MRIDVWFMRETVKKMVHYTIIMYFYICVFVGRATEDVSSYLRCLFIYSGAKTLLFSSSSAQREQVPGPVHSSDGAVSSRRRSKVNINNVMEAFFPTPVTFIQT